MWEGLKLCGRNMVRRIVAQVMYLTRILSKGEYSPPPTLEIAQYTITIRKARVGHLPPVRKGAVAAAYIDCHARSVSLQTQPYNRPLSD